MIETHRLKNVVLFIKIILSVVLSRKIKNEHYTCIACITIDSVMRIEKKNYPEVYLEECKNGMKKIKMIKFIEAELKSESESELQFDTELESKSDTE